MKHIPGPKHLEEILNKNKFDSRLEFRIPVISLTEVPDSAESQLSRQMSGQLISPQISPPPPPLPPTPFNIRDKYQKMTKFHQHQPFIQPDFKNDKLESDQGDSELATQHNLSTDFSENIGQRLPEPTNVSIILW